MARPRILPDADVLHQLRTTGVAPEGKVRPVVGPDSKPWPAQGPWSYEQIAHAYGVTKAAVHLALSRSQLVTPRPRYDEELPWLVATEHTSHYLAGMLRLAARQKRGLPIPPRKERYLNNWLENLAKPTSQAPLGMVVDYDRDAYPGGFACVPRRPGEEGLIRKPGGTGDPGQDSATG